MSMTAAQAWSRVSEERATIYTWLSGLFAQELTDEQVVVYGSDAVNAWFETLSAIGLETEVGALKNAIGAWHAQGLDALDLRSDFSMMFLLDRETSALPYASFYLDEDGLTHGEMSHHMKDFLAKNQLSMHSDFKEPADHLAVFLALMHRWCLSVKDASNWQEAAAEQAEFLSKNLMSWLPDFVAKAQTVDVISPFYPALAQLLLTFIQHDIDYLKKEAQGAHDQA